MFVPINIHDTIETFGSGNNPEYEAMTPLFNWFLLNIAKKTFQLSAQHVRISASTIMKKTYHSPYLALNVKQRSETFAIDTRFTNTLAIDDRSVCAQIFAGTKTLVADAYGLKSSNQFINSLDDNIRQRGNMDKVISDSAKSEISKRVKDA